MKKRRITGILCILFLLMISRSVKASTLKAVPSGQSVLLDGNKVSISAYLIQGNNYFKLRDVAAILKNTDSRFSVSYDVQAKTIGIRSGADYESETGDLRPLYAEPQDAVLSSQTVVIDGKKVSLKAYLIHGNNYFMLRELGEKLNFEVDFDASSRSVLISSRKIGAEHMAERIRLEIFPVEGFQIQKYLYDVHISVGSEQSATLNYDPRSKKLITLLGGGKNLSLGTLSAYVQQNGRREELTVNSSGILTYAEMIGKRIDLNQSYSILFVLRNESDGKLIPWVILEH